MQMTRVLVSFGQAGKIEVQIDVDLTLLLGSPAGYYQLVSEPADRQRADLVAIVPRLTDALRLRVGSLPLPLVFRQFTPADAPQADYLDGSLSKLSRFTFVAKPPPNTQPLTLSVPLGANIDYPVAYTVQIPAAKVSVTRWLAEGMHESEPFSWARRAPQVAASVAAGVPADASARIDPDGLSWPSQAALYLRLGFGHIVPEGLDHILFVLGLFFLGITWRKLLSQTTVFTVAHATTLFLSTYGVFRLPSRYVEPGIALSIAWIAIENVVRPKLGPGRLAVVFCFGLIHGLGFASSLSDVPFPRHDFLVALLGFNVGVDLGQLFIIALAFLAVGWFRHEPWFRRRIAVPCSLVIAAVGLIWAAQRIVAYRTL